MTDKELINYYKYMIPFIIVTALTRLQLESINLIQCVMYVITNVYM
jgi:hypothetical protein